MFVLISYHVCNSFGIKTVNQTGQACSTSLKMENKEDTKDKLQKEQTTFKSRRLKRKSQVSFTLFGIYFCLFVFVFNEN